MEAARTFDRANLFLRGNRGKLNYSYSDYVDAEGRLIQDPKLFVSRPAHSWVTPLGLLCFGTKRVTQKSGQVGVAVRFVRSTRGQPRARVSDPGMPVTCPHSSLLPLPLDCSRTSSTC